MRAGGRGAKVRFLRYCLKGETPQYGWKYEDQVGRLEGTMFGEFRRQEADIPIQRVQLLAPVLPGKIIGVEGNYLAPAQKEQAELPQVPRLYFKPPSTVIGKGSAVRLPPQSGQVEHEVHLAVVIGKAGRWVLPERAREHIFGYTIGIDCVARDLEKADGNPLRARSFDTFLALGPWIETDLDTSDIILTCRVNGELRQMASTREMVFTVERLVAFISSFLTLEPGDVILSGTPGGGSLLQAGDQVQGIVEEIGELVVPVLKSGA
jgi:2-keto-4-pentenoate hydratase/2-oxohepta-3-ene-1,7-dioic acid hydratase in catechol pathway